MKPKLWSITLWTTLHRLIRRELIEGGVKLVGLKEDMMELKRMIEKGDHAASVGNKELEIRVRTLENFRWWIAGAAGAAGLASGFLSRFIHN